MSNDGEPPKDDDLLKAIRTAVSDEVTSDRQKPPPLALTNPSIPGAPLVLGAAARVPPRATPQSGSPEARMFDEPELQAMIADLVREEVAQAMQGDLGTHLRKLVREELAELLARSREQ